jgi:hypothetical protein
MREARRLKARRVSPLARRRQQAATGHFVAEIYHGSANRTQIKDQRLTNCGFDDDNELPWRRRKVSSCVEAGASRYAP